MAKIEKIAKGLHNLRRYLEDKEWSEEFEEPYIDILIQAESLIKEQAKEIEILKLMGLKMPEITTLSDEKHIYTPVECKDCEYLIDHKYFLECTKRNEAKNLNWYCADGKPKE